MTTQSYRGAFPCSTITIILIVMKCPEITVAFERKLLYMQCKHTLTYCSDKQQYYLLLMHIPDQMYNNLLEAPLETRPSKLIMINKQLIQPVVTEQHWGKKYETELIQFTQPVSQVFDLPWSIIKYNNHEGQNKPTLVVEETSMLLTTTTCMKFVMVHNWIQKPPVLSRVATVIGKYYLNLVAKIHSDDDLVL